MPATIGRGAAGYTKIVTRSGDNTVHGGVFEFVRNAAFDARNFFDRRRWRSPGASRHLSETSSVSRTAGRCSSRVSTMAATGRLLRPVSGVPAGARHHSGAPGSDRGRTLRQRYHRICRRHAQRTCGFAHCPGAGAYPLPNDAAGPYGARTYAISSKVRTATNQFSIRVDHSIRTSRSCLSDSI